MPEMLFCGPLYTLQTNVVYAIPPIACKILCTDSSPSIQASTDPAFSTTQNITLSGGASGIAGFIRASTGTPKVMLTKA